MAEATDLLVDTNNPEALDELMQQSFRACLLGGPDDFERMEGHYILRCFGDPSYLELTIKNQGYATFIKRLEQLA